MRNTPKVVGGLTPACLERALALYSEVCDELVPVTSNDGIDAIWTNSRGRIDNTLQVAFGGSSSRYRIANGIA